MLRATLYESKDTKHITKWIKQNITHQSRIWNTACVVCNLGNDRLKVFFSSWRKRSIKSQTERSRIFNHGCKDNNQREKITIRPIYRWKRTSDQLSILVCVTYPERASWELSIFSFFARGERKKTLHACKFEMWEWKKRKGVVRVRGLELVWKRGWIKTKWRSKWRVVAWKAQWMILESRDLSKKSRDAVRNVFSSCRQAAQDFWCVEEFPRRNSCSGPESLGKVSFSSPRID